MRDGLTLFASILVAALTLGLVVPYVVDWTHYRALIEHEMSVAVGVPVSTQGRLDLALLPTPRLDVGHIEAGGELHAPAIVLDDVRLEMSISALLRGEVRFHDVTLAHPRLRVEMAEDGTFAVPEAWRSLPMVQFERIILHDAALEIVNHAAQTQFFIGPFELDAHIDSLLGPYRGEGRIVLADGPHGFRFSTAALNDGAMRLKWSSDGTRALPRFDVDGYLRFAPQGGHVTWALDGNAQSAGQSDAGEWQAQCQMRADAHGLSCEDGEWSVAGQTPHGRASGTGSAQILFGAPMQMRVQMRTPYLSLNQDEQLLKINTAADIADVIAALTRPLADMDGQLSFEADKIIRNGAVYSAVQLSLEHDHAGGDVIEVRTSLSDGSQFHLRGGYEAGVAPQFDGLMEADLRALSSLAPVVNMFAPDADAALASIPLLQAHVSSKMRVSAAGLLLQGLDVRAGDILLQGDVGLTRAIGAERARLYANINATSLSLAAWSDVSHALAEAKDMDVVLRFVGQNLRFEGVDGQDVVGSAALNLTRNGDQIDIDDLRLDVGTSHVRGKGFDHGGAQHIEAAVQGEQPLALARVLDRLIKSPWSSAFAARAVASSPLDLRLTYDGARRGADGRAHEFAFALKGSARGTHIDVDLQQNAQRRGGQILIDAPQSSVLLRQLGMETALDAQNMPAYVHVGFAPAAQGFVFTLDSRIAGVALAGQGQSEQLWPDSAASGDIDVNASDLRPFLRMTQMGQPATAVPLSLHGRWTRAGAKINYEDVRARIDDVSLQGDGLWQLDAQDDAPRFVIHADADHLTWAQLMHLMTGPSVGDANLVWSPAPFAAPLLTPPRGLVYLTAQNLDVTPDWHGKDGRFTLAFAPHQMTISDALLHFTDGQTTGRVNGRLSVKRQGVDVVLLGTAEVTRMPVSTPHASALVSALMEFSSQGASALDVVTHMTAAGRVGVDQLTVPQSDPAALLRLVGRASELGTQEALLMSALERELKTGPYRADYQEYVASMGGGQMRILAATSKQPTALNYDVVGRVLDVRLPLSVVVKPKEWSGPLPYIILQWSGTPDHLTRRIDASALRAGMASLVVARETARIEMMEAEAREQAFFARRQAGLRFLHQRQKEITDFKGAQKKPTAKPKVVPAPHL